MLRIISFSGLLMFLACGVMSCESDYTKTVKREIASGEKYNELFLGLSLGGTKEDFFKTCWNLNKAQKISHGPDNQYAKYEINLDPAAKDSQNVDMLFYGIFDSLNVMHGMKMKFSYDSWSIWNERYNADHLAVALKAYYLKKYGGNSFLDIHFKEINKTAFIKIDGNRQIKIYPIDNQFVRVKIEDLNYVFAEENL